MAQQQQRVPADRIAHVVVAADDTGAVESLEPPDTIRRTGRAANVAAGRSAATIIPADDLMGFDAESCNSCVIRGVRVAEEAVVQDDGRGQPSDGGAPRNAGSRGNGR